MLYYYIIEVACENSWTSGYARKTFVCEFMYIFFVHGPHLRILCACVRARVFVCVCARTRVHVCVCARARVCVCVCVCVCECVCVHYLHVCVHAMYTLL